MRSFVKLIDSYWLHIHEVTHSKNPFGRQIPTKQRAILAENMDLKACYMAPIIDNNASAMPLNTMKQVAK